MIVGTDGVGTARYNYQSADEQLKSQLIAMEKQEMITKADAVFVAKY